MVAAAGFIKHEGGECRSEDSFYEERRGQE
jgi:hypothetical protein